MSEIQTQLFEKSKDGEACPLELLVRLLPDFDDLYEFLKEHYKHSRFEGYEALKDLNGKEYAKLVTENSMEQLEKLHHGFISCHESYTGQMIKFNRDLEILNDDRPPGERVEYRHEKGHLTHLL